MTVADGPDAPTRSLVTPVDRRRAMVADVRAGLGQAPRWLPPKYFYDDRGSDLFDEITRLPEYYPTRAEDQLLELSADDIVKSSDARVLLELGSGSSEKTDRLLTAFDSLDHLEGYVPVDVSDGALTGAVERLRAARPSLPIYPVVADFDRHLAVLPAPGRRMVALLGSTVGNFSRPERADFFGRVAQALRPGETFLLGLDLVKDSRRIVAAYDDAAGVTAEFNRNVLHVLNRELAADFVPGDFEHVVVWDSHNEWIEMRLRARHAQTVTLKRAGLVIDLAAGEEIRTEISAKFRRASVESELEEAGLSPVGWWRSEDYALSLSQR